MSTDPYSPPEAELLDASNNQEWIPVYLQDFNNHVLFRRIFASLIDAVLFLACPMIFLFVVDRDVFLKYVPLYLYVGSIIYFSLMEGIWGCTIGKFICQIRVVNKYGEAPGIPKAIVRTIFRWFEANPFVFFSIPAGIVSFCSKRGQRLGDMVARTYVLKHKSLLEDNRTQPTIDEQEKA